MTTKQFLDTQISAEQARLWRAAPDLLAACEALASCPTVAGLSAAIRNRAEDRGVPDELEQARAAIAKAKEH